MQNEPTGLTAEQAANLDTQVTLNDLQIMVNRAQAIWRLNKGAVAKAAEEACAEMHRPQWTRVVYLLLELAWDDAQHLLPE